MDWTAKLDLYCERTGPELFSEPVNALTNIAFFLAAASVFTLSLVLRTVDQAVCPWLPPGTHFFWHLLNPLVLYLCVRALPTARKTME